MRSSTVWTAGLAVCLAVHLYATWADLDGLFVVSKLLLMPLLGLVVWTETTRLSLLYVAALALSWLGDAFLLGPRIGFAEGNSGYFLLGLSAFLLAHVCYLLRCRRLGARLPGPQRARNASTKPALLALAAWLLAVATGHVWNIEQGLYVPAALYAAVILLMLVHVWQLSPKPVLPKGANFPRIVSLRLGALLFVCSDALIGASVFGPLDNGAFPVRCGIMTLYVAGQYGLRHLAAGAGSE